MSTAQFLDKTAFDAIITSLEGLETNMETLFNSFDERYLGAFATAPTTDNNDEALTAGMLYTNTGTGHLNWYDGSEWVDIAAQAAAAEASATAAATSETNAENSATAAATSETNAGNSATAAATSEANAGTSETNAAASETKAEKWADEDEDVPVETSPDRFSSKHHALKSGEFYDLTAGLANYAGEWSTLTGALNEGSTVHHDNDLWFLLTDLADVTTSEPSEENSDWKLLTATILKQFLSAASNEYPFAEWTVGSGESSIDIGHSGNIEVSLSGSWLDASNYTLTGTTLTLDFELVAGDVVRVLKLSDLNGLANINDQTEETDPDPTDNFVAQKTGGGLIKVPFSSLGGVDYIARDFATSTPKFAQTFVGNNANVPDAETGQSWTNVIGNHSVVNGNLQADTANDLIVSNYPLVATSGDSDSIIVTTYGAVNIMFYQDADNYVKLVLDENGSRYIQVQVYENTGSGETLLATDVGSRPNVWINCTMTFFIKLTVRGSIRAVAYSTLEDPDLNSSTVIQLVNGFNFGIQSRTVSGVTHAKTKSIIIR